MATRKPARSKPSRKAVRGRAAAKVRRRSSPKTTRPRPRVSVRRRPVKARKPSAPPTKRAGRRRRDAARETERALERIGIENVRRGTVLQIGKRTRWITPTKRGRAVLAERMRGITALSSKALRGRAKHKLPPLFTVTVKVRVRGRGGEYVVEEHPNIVLPNAREIRKRRKPGESMHAAAVRMAEGLVQGVAREAGERLHGKGPTNPRAIAAAILRGKGLDPRTVGPDVFAATLEEARDRLRDIKSKRETQVQVTFHRVKP